MKKTVLVVALMFVFSSAAFAADDIVLLPGWKQSKEQLAVLGNRINGEVIMVENKLPLWTAVEELKEELGKMRKTGKVVLVGFSWGGLVARQFAETYPEKVTAVVVIGSPNGGYWFAPSTPFRVKGGKSRHIPLFIVAGEKSKKKWWLKEVNDGVVDLESVFSFDSPPMRKGLILNLSHHELWRSKVVADQIKDWLAETAVVAAR